MGGGDQKRARGQRSEGDWGEPVYHNQPTNKPVLPSLESRESCLSDREREGEKDVEGDGLHVDAWWYSCMCAPPWERYVVCVGVERG